MTTLLKDSAATILQLLLQLNFASLFDSRYSCNFLGCDENALNFIWQVVNLFYEEAKNCQLCAPDIK
jgi:hypothetical protein